MKTGKISESVLKRSVLRQLHTRRQEVILGAGVGEDCSAISVEAPCIMVFSTDPVTVSCEQFGRFAVYCTLNDLASSGAEPIGIMTSLLLPTSTNEDELRKIIKQIDEVCEQTKVQVLGGHTEVTRVVSQPVITVTGVGKAVVPDVISTAAVKPGMDILATKWIALEGTAILAQRMEEQLLGHFSQPFIDKAKQLEVYIPVWSEAAVAVKSGISAMHDVSEGGIFGALWEMAECAGVGLEIDLKRIPIRQETVEICEFFDINPYKLMSGGCMLMAAENGTSVVRALESEGISAVIIGKATDGNDRVLLQGNERRFLETTQTDEIHKVLR